MLQLIRLKFEIVSSITDTNKYKMFKEHQQRDSFMKGIFQLSYFVGMYKMYIHLLIFFVSSYFSENYRKLK